MNVTLQVVRQEQPAVDAQREGNRFKLGDIINIFETNEDLLGCAAGEPRLGFVHVTNVPIATLQDGNFLSDGHRAQLVDRDYIHRRIWCIDISQLPVDQQQDLTDTGHVIIDFSTIGSVLLDRDWETSIL